MAPGLRVLARAAGLISAALVLLCTSCAESPQPSGDSLHPNIVAARATQADDGTWTFDVTLSSPYDSPERYADAWRVVGPDGTEYAVRELLHDHASEQPFTRSLAGVELPAELSTVVIEGRDQVNGWGGERVELTLR